MPLVKTGTAISTLAQTSASSPHTGEAEVGGSLQPTDPRIDQQHRETLTENKANEEKHKPTLIYTKLKTETFFRTQNVNKQTNNPQNQKHP